MWVLTYKGTKKIHMVGYGPFRPEAHDLTKLDYHEVPDQPIDHLFQGDPPEIVGTLDDLIQYSPEEKAALIDRDTAKRINSNMHPIVPIEEQIGILREQIVQILNALGLPPTEEFAKLNEVAIQAIEEARKLKEGIYVENNQTS